MSDIIKSKSVLSVHVRARKLKGNILGREITLPVKDCEMLDIRPGDRLEIEIKTIRHPEIKAAETDEIPLVSNP